MNLFRFVLRNRRGMVALMALTALLSGACNAGLIAAVNSALHSSTPGATTIVLIFAALGVGRLVTSFVSQMMSVRFSQESIAGLRRDLVSSILAAPLRQLEQIGPARLVVALTEDVFHITEALVGLPLLAVNLALLLSGAVYLGCLSWKVLLGLMGLVALGSVGYRLLTKGAFHSLHMAREEGDRLFGHFRALTEGIKELKLHRNRRGVFLSRDIQQSTEIYQRRNVSAENRFILAQHWSHLLFYFLIGIVLFLVPTIGNISPTALTGYIITTLYLMGPLAGVLSSLAMFGRANVALQKIQQLGVSLASRTTEGFPITHSDQERAFQRLELINVTHTYHHEKDDSHFTLGPVNLVFEPGELVFVVGGNGSGKSTLAKIITGLYTPETGQIHLDGEVITDKNRDDYRQLFSTVFADFFVFETLLGLEHPHLDVRAKEYLLMLNLDHKVKVRDGVFSTTALSQGQRKRLALLTAYLENRPFCLFDEWASDQDPQFKDFFYTQCLRDLKASGKTVVIITHDDKYFHLADRIVQLDYGKLTGDTEASMPEAVQALGTCGIST